jgi:hypothetical protein
VIFQDDLAQIAASHLQENDLVYVSGQLTGDVPPFKHADGQANIQVCICCMYCTVLFCLPLLFVEGSHKQRVTLSFACHICL